MKRVILFSLLSALLMLALFMPNVPAPGALAASGGYSLRFYGHGANDIDRVKIKIDNPAVPADVGGDFTVEFWMKASLANNASSACVPGGNNWLYGNVIVDRDVFGNGDYGDYGISLANGRIAFGVSKGASKATLCGATDVANGQWHHVAVTRKSGTGKMKIFVDGQLDAAGNGPTGNVSYRNGRAASRPGSDPYLVLGASKRRAAAGFPSYNGFLDEVRISKVVRYSANFTRPSAPFGVDANTTALYRFNEGPRGKCSGVVLDSSSGGASNGRCKFGGSEPAGPVYSASSPFSTPTPTPTATTPPPASGFCPALPPPSGATVTVSTEAQLRNQAQNAAAGTTILIRPGTYYLTDIIHIVNDGITLRSSTGDRADVILDGGGMLATGRYHVILIEADDATIADLTIRNGDEHGVSVNGSDRPKLYNLHIFDTGYQLVKVNPIGDGSDDGLLACSRLEYTTTAPTDYTNGISAHDAHNWVVRDNQWYNIRTPNNVSAPTILFWSGSSGTIVERNLLVDNFQGIAFGNASHGAGDHSGGIVRNNFIYASKPHDSVIEMVHATGWLVANNTALLLDPYGGITWGMEARFSDTSGTFANNLTNMTIWRNRDGANGSISHNLTNAQSSWFVQPSAANLHLKPTASAAIDAATSLAPVTADIDGDPRPLGSAPDVGADEYNPAAGGKPTTLYQIEYSASSPFNQKIPANPTLAPNSATLVKSLIRDANNSGMYIVVDKWTVPVYYADANTPRYNVTLTASWARWYATKMNGVPIPNWAAPDPQDDGSMTVVDVSTNCQYDFWQAKKQNGQWSASWGNSLKSNEVGIFPKGLSARGSGFALLAGMIWPDELKNGKIEHALAFSYNYTRSGGPVSPATESDGESLAADAIPEGARIQLDPALNLDNLNLTPYEKTIAKAMQEYGMILGDNSSGGISLYAVSPLSAQGDPYAGVLPPPHPTYGTVYLPNIPVNKFRVIKFGPQNPDPEIALVSSGCAVMTK